MPPRARRIILALCIGLLITVALAWTAMFVPYGSHGYGPPTVEELGVVTRADGMKSFQISRGRRPWHNVISYWWMQISGLSLMMPIEDYEARKFDLDTLPSYLRPQSIDDLNMLSWYREVGWPMKALTCAVHWKTQISNANIVYTVEGGVQLPRDAEFNPRALPLTPLWPGFAVDVVMFAAAALGVMWVLAAARARLRVRRGCCAHCGYSRQGLAGAAHCPECGR